MKKTTKLIALVLALVMVVSAFPACGGGETANTPAEAEKPLVIGTQNFDGKFSPFFYTNAYENDVLGLVNVGLLGSDREGAVVLKGIEGEVRPYNGTDYTYTGIANCDVTENADGTVYYDFTLKEGVKFSDGTDVKVSDWAWSLYRARDNEESNSRSVAANIATEEGSDEDHTLVITLSKTDAAFLANLCKWNMVV